jgi:phospholipase C
MEKTNSQKEKDPMTNIWIRSAASPSAYLRMDSSKVTSFNGAGSGMVNCQYYGPGSEPQGEPGNDEVLFLVPLSGGGFAIRSTLTVHSFLRMDGSAVNQFNVNGSGTVNCQYYAQGTQPQAGNGNDEVFQLVAIPDSPAFAIRSMNYPNAYLRVASANVTAFKGSGSGAVNCQYYAPGTQPQWAAGNLEAFYISAVPN